MSACRSCGAPIVWAETVAGKLMPVDRDPVADGNVRLSLGPGGSTRSLTLSGPVLDEAREEGLELRLSHFVTCPQAAAHRRRSDGQTGRAA